MFYTLEGSEKRTDMAVKMHWKAFGKRKEKQRLNALEDSEKRRDRQRCRHWKALEGSENARKCSENARKGRENATRGVV